MASTKRSVTLTIAGHALSLKTDREGEVLHELAEYVSSLVEELRSAAPNVPMQKICLLVALKLADELYAERENTRTLCGEVERRSQLVLDLLDTELGEVANTPPA